MASVLDIKQVKSSNGASKKQLDSLRTLGLGKIGRQVQRPDDAVVRGLVASVDHLVKVGNDG
jgi:large subunit ribosomal protein L30